ncbi:glycosyl hydrolase family 18 protein [Vallitalea guaymasensis]|uniref:glycosyl hydrolase family 18 protein n=1 Tax=Vallitalea guaymasensis TaxID=1185412 RepID=UPI0023539455|nr:glycosyl hydrolase family 18 protein [Vallitalea guaymasensis]
MKIIKIVLGIILLTALLTVTTTSVYTTDRFNMSYLHYGSPKSYINYVNDTEESLDSVSPNYIDINSEGHIETNNIDTDFIKTMHDKGMKVTPFLSNHWNREAGELALADMENVTTEINKIIETYNFDGINVDIEGLNEQSREPFTEFICLLREKLDSNKELSISVAANPYGSSKGWQGMYDYKTLASYADYLMIMAYDESYRGSKPGPVASMSFVENSIKNAIDIGVPSEKIVLGIPFYGRIWNINDMDDSDKDNKILGKGITAVTIKSLVAYYNGSIIYDKESKSMKATFTVNTSDEKKNLYSWGVPVTEGNYEIWYDDDYTIKEKLKLVSKYNLKGTGSWSLGQENKEIWKYYISWLNGNYFSDVSNHWAKKDISTIYEKDWMLGTSSTLFCPDTSLTRAQAAVTLIRALDIDLDSTSSYFVDVPDSYWAKSEIETAYKCNIINGKDKKIFDADSTITREELAKMLYNLLESNIDIQKADNNFKDISPNSWSYEAITALNCAGILKGYDENTFRPRDTVTRAQMACVLNRISIYIE